MIEKIDWKNGNDEGKHVRMTRKEKLNSCYSNTIFSFDERVACRIMKWGRKRKTRKREQRETKVEVRGGLSPIYRTSAPLGTDRQL